MSQVTSIILKLPWDETSTIHDVNLYFDDAPLHKRGFVDCLVGDGDKVIQPAVWAGAFGSLDVESFLSWCRTIVWNNPEQVQIFICEEDEDNFRERFHQQK